LNISEKQKYIFGSLFLLANKLQAIGDQYLGKDGMTTKQWFLTAMIAQFGNASPTLSEVAELAGSSRQNVKQLALKLEEKDFLRIVQDEHDARALRLKLTEKSNEFWNKRQEQDNQFISELFQDITEEETDLTVSSFQKLFKVIDKMGNLHFDGEDSK
jgi:DNA-binding MarR family transcriptional regulator